MGELAIQLPLCVREMGVNTKIFLTAPEKLTAHNRQCGNNTDYILNVCCKLQSFESRMSCNPINSRVKQYHHPITQMTEGVRGVSKRDPKKSDCRVHLHEHTHRATSMLQQHKNLVAAKSTKCQDRERSQGGTGGGSQLLEVRDACKQEGLR